MNKEIPILFSTPMVQAILEGRKTMTRRIVKFPKDFTGEVFNNAPYGLKYSSSLMGETVQRLHCPYGQPGDILWVRESFNYFGSLDPGYLSYKATYPKCLPAGIENVPDITAVGWKPSIHMPKAICRIWLEVTSVRVERLQDITESDAKAEGVEKTVVECVHVPSIKWKNYKEANGIRFNYATNSFESLWQSINGEESWNANPWVWVVEFKKLEGRP